MCDHVWHDVRKELVHQAPEMILINGLIPVVPHGGRPFGNPNSMPPAKFREIPAQQDRPRRQIKSRSIQGSVSRGRFSLHAQNQTAWVTPNCMLTMSLQSISTSSTAPSMGSDSPDKDSCSRCTDLDVFAQEPALVTHLDLTRSRQLTQPGKLEDLVLALQSKSCRLGSLNLSCNNFGAAGAVLSHPFR